MPFFTSAVYVPPSILQYPLSSPCIRCPSTVLLTPSHIPVFLLQHIQSPKCLPLSLTSFTDWAIPLLPPTATDFHILSLGQAPARAPAFSCQTVDDEKWRIFFFRRGFIRVFLHYSTPQFSQNFIECNLFEFIKKSRHIVLIALVCNSRPVPLSRHLFQASTTVEFDSNSG